MKKKFFTAFAALLSLFLIGSCTTGNEQTEEQPMEKIQDLANAKIGVVPGTYTGTVIPQLLPNATYLQYQSVGDMIQALEAKKIDAFGTDESVYTALLWEGKQFDRLKEPIESSDYGVIFPKGKDVALQTEFNNYLSTITDNGYLEDLRNKWFGSSEPTETAIDYDSLTGDRVLKIGVCSSQKPFVYIKNQKLSGFDIEILTDFARKHNYRVDFEDSEFSGVLSGVSTQKYDMGACGLTITAERRESVDFSNVYHVEDLVFVLRKSANRKLTLADFQGSDVKVGYATASYASTFVRDVFPNAQFFEFQTVADCFLALTQGKIDIIANDVSYYTCMRWEGMNVERLEEPYEVSDYGIAFKKGENTEVRLELNEFIKKIKNNGVYDNLQAKWFGDKEPEDALDPYTTNGTKRTLRVVFCNETKPFGYIKNGKIAGYDVDLLTLFANEYNYKLEVNQVNFPGVLAGLNSGMYDLAASGLTITDERRESIDFSDTYHQEEVAFIIQGRDNPLAQFEKATLGVVTGSLYGGYCRERFPNATIKEFNNFADVLFALKQGKVDGIMIDRPNFNSVSRDDSKLEAIRVPEYSVDIGFGFQKNAGGDTLQAQMNALLAEKKADGSLDVLIDKWYGKTEPDYIVPLEELANNPTKLKVAIDTTRKPFVYLGKDSKPAGFEIEMLYLFCQKYGYSITYEDLSFAVGIAGLATNTYDLVCGGLYMTEERKQSVNFSDSYMTADVVMAKYIKSSAEAFFQGIADSFEKTFIREGRWKLILEGLGITLLISVGAIVGGTAFGFGLYMLSRSKNKVVAKITKGFNKVYGAFIAGTPTLVILMILYYIIFGTADIDGVFVAIIGFILIFGSFVYKQLGLTVDGIDRGQTEAAYALGYSRNQTFFKIILPQALRMFIPTYSGEVVSLIKATSVVGYIAVNDLTKMGDIIRGNTYEAFFPLIAIAIIYFLVIWGVSALMKLVLNKTNPKNRKKENILKGVEK